MVAPACTSRESRRKPLKQIWIELRKEIYDLFCTDSEKYAKERTALSTTLKPAIAALAAFLTKDYGYLQPPLPVLRARLSCYH